MYMESTISCNISIIIDLTMAPRFFFGASNISAGYGIANFNIMIHLFNLVISSGVINYLNILKSRFNEGKDSYIVNVNS